MNSRGRVARGGGEVTRVIANLTVPDGHRSQAIYVGRGAASSQEALTYCGRQGPPEGILVGWASKEALKVPTGDMVLCEICWFQKSTELLIQKLPFLQLVCKIALEVGKYDLHFKGMLSYACRKLQKHI